MRALRASSPPAFRYTSVPKTDPEPIDRAAADPPRLFGTDGVRGTAGQYPLDRETISRLGAALVRALPHDAGSAHLLVGRDTRESGSWIEVTFAHGVVSQGGSVTSAGIVPTPGVAYLTRNGPY